MQHEIVMPVAAGIEKCYSIWSDRLNWLQWFDMIEEVRCVCRGQSPPAACMLNGEKPLSSLLAGWNAISGGSEK